MQEGCQCSGVFIWYLVLALLRIPPIHDDKIVAYVAYNLKGSRSITEPPEQFLPYKCVMLAIADHSPVTIC